LGQVSEVYINFITSEKWDSIAKLSTLLASLVGKKDILHYLEKDLLIYTSIWYWNCYPGARVDSDVPLYEYSIEDLYKDWTWSERFPSWPELRKYFAYVDKKLDLSKDVMLNTVVKGADFDKPSCRWNVRLASGEVLNCKYFILCTGFAAKDHVPDFKGLDKYKGIMHHTGK
jgi:cation diffusion facilitator CzcD-associated flavoprotein CzcO